MNCLKGSWGDDARLSRVTETDKRLATTSCPHTSQDTQTMTAAPCLGCLATRVQRLAMYTIKLARLAAGL